MVKNILFHGSLLLMFIGVFLFSMLFFFMCSTGDGKMALFSAEVAILCGCALTKLLK